MYIGALRADQARGAAIGPVQIEKCGERLVHLRLAYNELPVAANKAPEIFAVDFNGLRLFRSCIQHSEGFLKDKD